MAGTVKANIVVNANEAIKELGRLSEQGELVSRSLADINKAIDKGKYSDLVTIVRQQALAFQAADVNGNSYAKTVRFTASILDKMTKSGNFSAKQLAAMRGELEKASAAAKRFSESQKTGGASGAGSISTGLFGKTGELFKNIIKFQLIMKPITMGMSALSDGITNSAAAAAEAEQVYSKLNTVFEGMSDTMERAQKLAGQLGTATSTSASALSTVGDLLQAQGMGTAQSLELAEKWVSQFQDIIAFKDVNMSLEEFAGNFMSGAAGNLRNFRTFGSIVNESTVKAELAKQGLDKLTGSQLELAKVTTRAELALKQQANAIGATAREYDTAQSVTRRFSEANKRLEESIGKSINGVLKPLKEAWTDVANAIATAAEMQERYNNGTSGSSWTGSDADMKGLRKIAYSAATDNLGDLLSPNVAKKTITSLMNASGASSDEVIAVLLEQIGRIFNDTAPFAEIFKKVADAAAEVVEADKRLAKAQDARITAFQSKKESTTAFYESMASLLPAGALSMPDFSFESGSARGLALGNAYMAQLEQDAISAAMTLTGKTLADLLKEANVFDIATSNTSSAALASGYTEQMKTLYEALNNYSITNNVDVSGYLAIIASSVKNIQGEVEKEAEEEARNKAILEAQTSAQASVDATISGARESGAIRALSNRGYSQNIASLIISQQKAMQEFQLALYQGGYAVEDATALMKELNTEQEIQLKEAKAAEIDKEANQPFSIADEWISQVGGDIGTFYTAITNLASGIQSNGGLSGSGMTGLIGLILAILKKLEIWDDLMDAIDQFFEGLNGLFKPLSMLIQFINESVKPVNDAIMKDLLPIIKIIAAVFATLNAVSLTILHVLMGIGYAVTFQWSKAKEQFSQIGELWQSYGETMEDIKDYTYQIANENSEYNKVLYEMFTKGLINYDEYASMYKGDKSDVINTASFGSGYTGTYSKAPYNYNSGNITVYVSGEKSMDEIYEFCERKRAQIEVTG